MNIAAITIFLSFVALTLGITWWAATRTRSQSDFYTAGGSIKPWQNGLAIAGDFMSAATFLGITSAIYFRGYDSFILGVGVMACWPLILFMITERLRNLGQYTFVDVVSFRLSRKPIRVISAFGSLAVVIFYLIGQMVGAGKLIELLFGIDYLYSVLLVNILMILYVSLGGMIATTWVQLIKAILLLVGGVLLGLEVMAQFGFSFDQLFAAVSTKHPMGADVLAPGGWLKDPRSLFAVGVTVVFGFIGLPHILMRFFTVKDACDARKSVFYATSVMGFFYLLILIIGFGSIPIILGNADYLTADGSLLGGRNMVALHLSHYVGGDLLFGFMCAVTFATILAVVSGLTLSAATTVAHDLYAQTLHDEKPDEAKEKLVSRVTILVVGVLSILLGIIFEYQNVVFVVTISLAVAASVNFPILVLAMYWRGLTTRGVIAGGIIGLISSLGLVFIGPQIWVDILGYATPLFNQPYPTLVSMPLAFFTCFLFSVTDRSERAKAERAAFDAQLFRSESGVGISEAVSH